MPLVNEFIGYLDRSYEQFKASILAKTPAKFPEMTDHTENNIWIRTIGVWGGILEHINYYLGNKAREVYIPTLRKFVSIVKLAKTFDYRIKGTSAASVSLTFFFDNASPSDILIPAGTQVKTKEGISFLTLADTTILTGQTQATVDAKNWTRFQNQVLGNSTGLADQIYDLVENVVDGTVVVRVGVTTYQAVDTLAYSLGSSTHFVHMVTEAKKMSVLFGDNVSGKIPPIGQEIQADYYTSNGEAGNVGAGSITEVVSSITVPSGFTLKVTNPLAAAGGVNQEGLTVLKKRIPRSIRTLMRAITHKDYKDIAELFNGVAKAAVDWDCGKTVDLYIAPEGGGLASETLRNDVLVWFDDKRMITTTVRVLAAGLAQVYIRANVTALSNYNNLTVRDTVKNRILEFLDEDNQEISGRVDLGDIYEIIETSEGVQVSEIIELYVLPFALPFGDTTTALSWTRTLKEASTETKSWKIVMSNPTVYQLYRDNAFLGLFNVGTTYDFDEIQINITANGYIAGDQWTFNTYKFFGSIQLEEFSIPYADSSSVVVNVTGGI